LRKAVESKPQKAAEQNIENLRLRLELLRNMRMNWKDFEKDSAKRGIELRINQYAALVQIVKFLETGNGEEMARVIDLSKDLYAYQVQPTGAGKTGTFAIETALMSVPTLILVPFDSLLRQTRDDLIRIGGIDPADIGFVGGGVKEIGRTITVATYAGHAALMRKGGPYATFVKEKCKLVICDEVHAALGKRTQESLDEIDGMTNSVLTKAEHEQLDEEAEVLEHLETETGVTSLKIGYTATDTLSQKRVIDAFPHFLGRVYQSDMVEAGFLVPYRIIQCDGSVFAGELEKFVSEEKEAEILRREKIYGKLAGKFAETLETYRQFHEKYPLRAMAFCTNHAECEQFVKEAEEYDLRCAIVTGREAKGKQGWELIDDRMEELLRGDINIVVTVEKLATGFNRREINAILWARVTSMAKTIQGIGRGGRCFEEDGFKKDCCWLFEANWALKDNVKRGKRPLRYADALAMNGENPEKICGMANGKVLEFEKPLTVEEICEQIKTQFTPKRWADMRDPEKRKFKIRGHGLIAIAGILGLEGNPIARKNNHFAVGRVVWGEDHPTLQPLEEIEKEELTRDEMINLLRQTYSAKHWAEMTQEIKKNVRIGGRGLAAIASLLGKTSNPVKLHSDHLALGRVVWGKDHPALQEGAKITTRNKFTKIEAAEMIDFIDQTHTPEQWATMSRREKKTLKVKGFGMKAINSLLGLEGDPVNNYNDLVALGRLIWGDDHPALQPKEIIHKEELTADEMKELLRQTYTYGQWTGMGYTARKTMKVGGHGLKAITALLGIKIDPVNNLDDHLALGQMIWGKNPHVLQSSATIRAETKKKQLAADQMKQLLRQTYTPESWAEMDRQGRDILKVGGHGLKAIARLLGVEGDPVKKINIYLLLGRMTWGDDHPALQAREEINKLEPEKKAITADQMKHLLFQTYTAQQWMEMTMYNKERFKIAGYGLKAVARLFKIDGNPIKDKNVHSAIGREVWAK